MNLFIYFLFVSIINANELQETRDIKYADIQKFKLADWIKQNFKTTLIKTSGDTNEELKRFQHFILGSRNAECLYKKYGNYDMLNHEMQKLNNQHNSVKWLEFSKQWKNFNRSFEKASSKELVSKFNNMVNYLI